MAAVGGGAGGARRRRRPRPSSDTRGWLGEELPLPLAVRTAQDLAVKAAAEKQYLIFNLLAGGKLAWDAGDFATAAGKWEALLRVHGVDPEIEKVIRPLAREARARAGGARPRRRPWRRRRRIRFPAARRSGTGPKPSVADRADGRSAAP